MKMAKVVLFVVTLLSLGCFAYAVCSLGITENGVPATDQNKVVAKHNALRLQLAQGKVPGQPRATNMLRMQYDSQLATKAQEIADTCEFKHVTVTDSRWSWVGQNLYISMSTACAKGSDWDSAIQSWFDEYKDYTYPSAPDAKTGHYTQVAWAKSNYVGCGYTFFQANSTYKCQKLYVCNYGPGGNIIGQPPYQTGSSGCDNLC